MSWLSVYNKENASQHWETFIATHNNSLPSLFRCRKHEKKIVSFTVFTMHQFSGNCFTFLSIPSLYFSSQLWVSLLCPGDGGSVHWMQGADSVQCQNLIMQHITLCVWPSLSSLSSLSSPFSANNIKSIDALWSLHLSLRDRREQKVW